MSSRSFTLTKKHIALTFAALGAMLLWIFLWILAGVLTGGGSAALHQSLMPAGPLSPMPVFADGIWPFTYVLFQACLLAPVVEELFWRWLFCSIAYDSVGKARANWSLPLMVGTCGLLFGLSHGFRYGFTYEMIIRMSVIGAILGVLWVLLKRSGAGALTALFCCVFAHGAYNFSVSAMQAIASQSAVQGYKLGTEESFEKCKAVVMRLMHQQKPATEPKSEPEPEPTMSPVPPNE
jgi:hypothetical protein